MRKFTPELIAHAKTLFSTGKTVREIATLLACSPENLGRYLREGGIDTKINAQSRMPHNKKTNIDEDLLIDQYVKGASVLKLARQLGVARCVITRILQEKNLPIRDASSSNFLRMGSMSQSEKQALTFKANEAVRKKPKEWMSAINRKKSLNAENGIACINIGPGEKELKLALQSHFSNVVAQKSFDVYSVDLVIDDLAIEVKFGSGGSSKARQQENEKVKYLLSQGMKICYVCFTDKTGMNECMSYVVNMLKLLHASTPKQGQYWIVKCGLQQSPSGRFNGRATSLREIPPELVASLREVIAY